MSNFKKALTRKIGPLAAWVWALIAFVGIYFYRKRFGAQASGTGTGSVAPAGPTPGTGEQVLQPGESIYDPTAGTLQTAPGGGGGTGSGDTAGSAADLAGAMDALATAIANGMPPEQIDVGSSIGDPTSIPAGTPPGGHVNLSPAAKTALGGGKRGQKKGIGSALTGKGAFAALTGGKRGAAKSKGQHNATKKTSNHTPKGAKGRARSTATQRNNLGGRTSRAIAALGQARLGVGGAGVSINRNSRAGNQPSRARQNTRTPARHVVVQQRRAATTPRPAPTRQSGHPAPRPSAPPPRTQRAPAPAPPPRHSRPHHRGR